MSLFRRREPVHVRLAREGGLIAPGGRPFPWQEVGIHGVNRPREWDAVVAVEAPGLQGDEASFVVLAGGDLVVEVGEGDLTPLADALDEVVAAPYRAVAVRRGEAQWAAAAKAIVVAAVPDAPGDELELAVSGGDRSLRVDGEPAFGSVPALEALAQGDSAIRATRIDGDLFEVRVDAL
jgi:hypothetical protein